MAVVRHCRRPRRAGLEEEAAARRLEVRAGSHDLSTASPARPPETPSRRDRRDRRSIDSVERRPQGEIAAVGRRVRSGNVNDPVSARRVRRPSARDAGEVRGPAVLRVSILTAFTPRTCEPQLCEMERPGVARSSGAAYVRSALVVVPVETSERRGGHRGHVVWLRWCRTAGGAGPVGTARRARRCWSRSRPPRGGDRVRRRTGGDDTDCAQAAPCATLARGGRRRR